MTNIIALSGKKQSGKDTITKFILGLHLQPLNICQQWRLTEDGDIMISDVFGDKTQNGVIDLLSPESSDFYNAYIKGSVGVYSFADALKQKVCIDTLGLHPSLCYGSNEDKEQITHLLWENMPGVVTPSVLNQEIRDTQVYDVIISRGEYCGLIIHAPGPMTAREVMQYVGTEIFRKMYWNVWVDATLRQIHQDSPKLAIITDCRFKNEADAVKDTRGKVVRLTRNPLEDTHESETALDGYEGFDYVVDNKELDIFGSCQAFYKALEPLGWLP